MRNLWTILLSLSLGIALIGCPADDDDSATDDDDDTTDDDDDATGDDDDATGDDDSTGDDDTTSPWDGSVSGTLTANAMAPTATAPFTMRVLVVDNADWAQNGFAATPLNEVTLVSDLPAAYTIGYTEGLSVEVLAFLDENENGTVGDAGDLASFSMAPVTVSATMVDLDFMMAVP